MVKVAETIMLDLAVAHSAFLGDSLGTKQGRSLQYRAPHQLSALCDEPPGRDCHLDAEMERVNDTPHKLPWHEAVPQPRHRDYGETFLQSGALPEAQDWRGQDVWLGQMQSQQLRRRPVEQKSRLHPQPSPQATVLEATPLRGSGVKIAWPAW